MFGLLFNLGFISVFSYGVILSLGILVAAFIFWRELSHTSWDEDAAFSLVIKSLFWAFVLGRLIQLVLSYHLGWQYFFKWGSYPGVNGWAFWFVFWLLSWYQVKKTGWPEWQFLDILAWVSLVFLFWLSLSCFGGWCWLGKITSFPLAWPVLGQPGRRYPLSLFHLLFTLGLLTLFSKLRFRYKTLKWYPSGRMGFVFWLSQASYALGHFLFIDLWRVNPSPLVFGLDLTAFLWLISGLSLWVVFAFWANLLHWSSISLLKLKKKDKKRTDYQGKKKG